MYMMGLSSTQSELYVFVICSYRGREKGVKVTTMKNITKDLNGPYPG